MTDIIRQQSPSASSGAAGQYKPEELNADLAAASLAKDLVNKLPTPAIDTRKFTIIHGLMQSLNHEEPQPDGTGGNPTYIDTRALIKLMDQVSEKSVNVDGRYFSTIFAYLMKPKYVIQGMPQTTTQEEEKPSTLSKLLPWNWRKNKSQEAQKQ